MNDLEKLQNIRINYAFNKISDYRIDQELCAFVGLSLFGNILDDCSLFGAMFLCGCAIVKDLISIKKQTDFLISKLYIYDGNEISEKYKLLKEKYDIYLKKLALCFEELDLKDPLDIGLYFSRMLHNGELSITCNYKYKHTKMDKDTKNHGTLGARVISGYGVCRNLSALLNDLYKELGYNTYFLLVKFRKIGLLPRHAVVLIKDKSGNFIIDPTESAIGIIDDSYLSSKKIIRYNGCEINKKFYLYGYIEDYHLNKITKDFFDDSPNNREFDNIFVENKNSDIIEQDFNLKFRENNLELMQEISDMEQVINLPKVKKKIR